MTRPTTRCGAKLTTLVITLVLLSTGCQSSPPLTNGFRMPGAPKTAVLPGASTSSAMPAATNSSATPATPKTSPLPGAAVTSEPKSDPLISMPKLFGQTPTQPAPSAVAQVGFIQPNYDPNLCEPNGVAEACGPNGCGPDACGPNGCGQRNGPIRNLIAAGACGCGSCQSGNCPTPAPHGYVEFAPQGWNAFGIDPQEFICDGGDNPPRAFLSQSDKIVGLQPEDTVVHYTTEAGDIKFQPSNKTCVYSPRFASIRKQTSAIAGEKVITASLVDRPVGLDRFQSDQPGLVVSDFAALGHADVAKRIDSLRDRNRGVRLEGDQALVSENNVLQVLATLRNLRTDELLDEQLALISDGANAAVAWTIDESVEVAIEDLKAPTLSHDRKVDAFVLYEFPDAGRLQIVKMADKFHAPSGDEVSFAIRVQNVGDSAVNNVVITDNLITRLQYVPESQNSDRKTEFSADENPGQSLRLQWKITEELKVGESALIEFKCKVR